MKKLFLLSMFIGFTSFASTNVETTNEKNLVKEQTLKQKVFLFQNESVENGSPNYDVCHNEANGVRNATISNGGTIEQANSAYYQALFSCLRNKSVSIQP